MLHELLDLRTCLFAASQKLDAPTAHERKLEIIERNLYGVDLDSFAVNIARLRLWLSLAVEFEGTVPPPLPNLDFKIEQGDALAAPAPQDLFQRPAVIELQKKKAEFLRSHGQREHDLFQEIQKSKADLVHWQQVEGTSHGFNWGVEFAEVFLGQAATTTIGGDLNLGHELAATPQRGGFDIIVANPPYVRQELIKSQKPILRKRFPRVFGGAADLFIYFFARANELLRSGGVAAFISSNKWLRAGYGEQLRQHILDEQKTLVVADFGDLPVFQDVAILTAITIWKKHPRGLSDTTYVKVADLEKCYADGIFTHFKSLAQIVPASQFGEGKARLSTAAAADLRSRMEKSGQRLISFLKGGIINGVKTGLNDAFEINAEVRERLIGEDPKSSELIKPLVVGDDVRRYELHRRDFFLLYVKWDTDIKKFPAILKWLAKFRPELESRDSTKSGGPCPWFALSRPRPEARILFESPKILFPVIGKSSRFVMDENQTFGNDKVFMLPTDDWFLLGVLNSTCTTMYLREICSQLLGGVIEFRDQYLETLPIPNASFADRKAVGEMARKVQALHGQRRTRVEHFLRDLGLDPAQITSRNPLEQPWLLSVAEFAKRVKRQPVRLYESARDETSVLTEQIARLESEIDARVATLYGLDAEDQRWAAQASPSPKSDDKQSLFFGVLGKLKERRPYFRFDEIQTAANDSELALKDSSLKVYLSEAVKQGHIHDAGRGWYSRLSEPVPLDPKPVAKLIRTVEKAFPLLEFTVWSTAQINPWMHHLLAQPVAFLHAPTDALESVGDTLRAQGWEVAVDPGKKEGPKAVRPGDKMVVLRPTHSKQPAPMGRQAKIEQILVDLQIEAGHLKLMDTSEAQGVIRAILNRHLVQVAELQMYADFRTVKLNKIEIIN
jgi:hypothetical protein